MRLVTWLAMLVLLAATACEGDYDPPQPFGVGEFYGNGGRAYAGQSGGAQPVRVPDAAEEPTPDVKTTDGEVTTDIADVAPEISQEVQDCIANQGYAQTTCECLEGVAPNTQPFFTCICESEVCVENPVQAALTYVNSCIALGYTGGLCGG